MTSKIGHNSNMTDKSKEDEKRYVSFLDNDALENEIRHLLDKAEVISKKMTDEKMHKNVMDPLGALIEQAGFNLDYEQWLSSEKNRQMQKSLNNAVGEFHQKIIGNIPGWSDLGKGNIVDLLCKDEKIIAEVKNKHNTVTGGKLMDVYDTLYDEVMKKSAKYCGYTAYFVQIIPSQAERYDKPFTPSDSKTGVPKGSNEKIRVIDGYSFYELASGVPNAYSDLFKCLPEVIEKVSGRDKKDFLGTLDLFKRAYG